MKRIIGALERIKTSCTSLPPIRDMGHFIVRLIVISRAPQARDMAKHWPRRWRVASRPSLEDPRQCCNLSKVDDMRMALREVFDAWVKGKPNPRAQRAKSLRKKLTFWHVSLVLRRGLSPFLFECVV